LPSYDCHRIALTLPQLQQIAATVKSERRPEERRGVLQNTMAGNINRWQETLDRLEDELVPPNHPPSPPPANCHLQNHAKAVLRRDYAVFIADRDRKLQDAAAAKEKASTPAAPIKTESAPQDDLIMLDAAPASFAKTDRAAAPTSDPKPSTPAAQQGTGTPASQTNTPTAPGGATSVPGDDDGAAKGGQPDAGLDIAAMLQVLTGGGGSGAAASASPGVMNLDGGGGAGGFGEPVLLPGLESYASMSEAQSASDAAANKPGSSTAAEAGSLPGGDADVLGDDNMDDLFGSDNGDGAAEFSDWLNDLGN
jgi:hypothetical protein